MNDPVKPPQLHTLLQEAAESIWTADFLLIATGAGFSADSGLPTYADVARHPVYQRHGLEYGDLCRTTCLNKYPELFYGFWGSCFRDYQDHTPHTGYHILRHWCERKAQRQEAAESSTALPCYYHYTSNVDGHLRKVGFPSERIHEMHGCIDTWLALARKKDDVDGTTFQNHPLAWIELPSSFRFPIDKESLQCSLSEVHNRILAIVNDPQLTKLDPTQIRFRPRILMFDDGIEAHEFMRLKEASNRYQEWEEKMELQMAKGSQTLTVLEIGCGTRVPSVRQECQDVVLDTALRCHADLSDDQDEPRCTHIRINPDDFEIEYVQKNHVPGVKTISLQGNALEVLSEIDQRIKGLEETTGLHRKN